MISLKTHPSIRLGPCSASCWRFTASIYASMFLIFTALSNLSASLPLPFLIYIRTLRRRDKNMKESGELQISSFLL